MISGQILSSSLPHRCSPGCLLRPLCPIRLKVPNVLAKERSQRGQPPITRAGTSDQAGPLTEERYKVFVDKQDFPIRSLIEMKNDGDLHLKPSYQRDFVWKEPKSSRLIETILLKLPIQEMWLHEQHDERKEVIDGQQRLTTIIAFERGHFDDGTPFYLQRLEILEALNGKTYADLKKEHSPFVSSFKNYILCLRVVKHETDPAGVFEVYQRINTGAENLNAQQIRRAAYRGPYIDLLHKLAKDHMSALQNSATSFTKEQDRELILRFFAMHNSLQNFTPPLSRFLNKEIRENQHMGLQKAIGIFGPDVFRKWDGKKFTGGAVDVSLWDTVMLTLVDYSSADLQRFADKLQPELLQLKLDIQAESEPARVTQDKIKARKKEFTNRIDAVRGATSHHRYQPRNFPPEVKAELFAANRHICSYCGQDILRLEDAQVDHIIPFSKGGMTEASNAQLLHIHCNQKKSNLNIDSPYATAELDE